MPRTRGRKSKTSESKEESTADVTAAENEAVEQEEQAPAAPEEESAMQEEAGKEEQEQMEEGGVGNGDDTQEEAAAEQAESSQKEKTASNADPKEEEEEIVRYKPQKIPGFSNTAVLEKWEWHMRVFPIDQADIRSCVLESVSKIAQETWMYIDKQNYGMGAFDLCLRNCNDALVVMSKLLQMQLMYRYVTVEITRRGRAEEKMKNDDEDDDEEEDIPYTKVLEQATVLLDYVHTATIQRIKGKEMKRSLYVKYLPENTSKELLKVLFPTANNLDILTTAGGRRYADLNVSTPSNVLAIYSAYVTVQMNGCKNITLEWKEEKIDDGILLKKATAELPWEIIPRNVEYEYEAVPLMDEDETRSFTRNRREYLKSLRAESGRERGEGDASESHRRRDHDRPRYDRHGSRSSDHKDRRRDDRKDRSRDRDRNRNRRDNRGWDGGHGGGGRRGGGRWNGPPMGRGGFYEGVRFPFFPPAGMGPFPAFEGPMPPFGFNGPRPRFDDFGPGGGRYEDRQPRRGRGGKFEGGRPSRFDQPEIKPENPVQAEAPANNEVQNQKASSFDSPIKQVSSSEVGLQGSSTKGGRGGFGNTGSAGGYNNRSGRGGFGSDRGGNYRGGRSGGNFGGSYQSKFGNQSFGNQMGMGNQNNYSTMQGDSFGNQGNMSAQQNFGNQGSGFGGQSNFNNQGFFGQGGGNQQNFGNQQSVGGNQGMSSNQQNYGNQSGFGGNQNLGGNQQQNFGSNQQSFGNQGSFSGQQNYSSIDTNFGNQQSGNLGDNLGQQNYGTSNYSTQSYNTQNSFGDNSQQNYPSQDQNYGNYSTGQTQNYNTQGQQQSYGGTSQQQKFNNQQSYDTQQNQGFGSSQNNYSTQQNSSADQNSYNSSLTSGGYWGQNNYTSGDQNYGGAQQQGNQSSFNAPGTGYSADATYASQGLYAQSDTSGYGPGSQNTMYSYSQYQGSS